MHSSKLPPRGADRTRRVHRLLLVLGGSFALAASGLAPAPLLGQTLEMVSFPLERFPIRSEGDTFVDPYSAAFAPAAGNGYYALWFEVSIEGPGPGQLLGQRFTGADLPVGAPRSIDLGVRPAEPRHGSIQLRRQGDRMLAIWQYNTSASPNIFGRFLGLNGSPLSKVFSIGNTFAGSPPGFALLESGRALVVWQDAGLAGHPARGRIVEPDGTLGPVLHLAGSDARSPAVGADEHGRYFVVWKDFQFGAAPHFDLLGRWLDSDGQPAGAPVLITRRATSGPALATWPDGRSVVSWSTCSDAFGQQDCDLHLRRLDSEGQPIGPAFRLSPNDGRNHIEPAMTIGPDGTLFVSWQGCSAFMGGNLGECLFHAVAFDEDGERLDAAPVLQVAGEPVHRKVVALEDDFLVSWYSFNAKPDGIYTQRYRLTGDVEPPPPPPPPPPAGVAPLTSPEFPDFRFWVRIDDSKPGTMESVCIPETICVSGALPGRSEVFLRVVGPRPNGFLWPTLVKFTTSKVEVWIEQLSTSTSRYYELAGATPGSSELPGLFDRNGFQP